MPAASPDTRLVAPSLALASCIRAIVLRNTLQRPPMAERDRLNHHPATPFCSIYWLFDGDVRILEPVLDPSPVAAAGSAIFCGPQLQPTVSFNSGPVHFMTILFFPDAWHRLTGMDMNDQMNRLADVNEVLDAEWQELSRQVLAASGDEARIALIEAFLEPRWRAARSGSGDGLMTDWVNRLGAQAAAAGIGRSMRMVERRVREWAGRPLRTLRRMRRAEQSFLEARSDFLDGRVSLSDVAARGGYADQAHMSREAREITGISPSELLRRIREEESYWMYRIWS
ncbi:helix-turn-helix domain-containing protein [Massilia sp. MB5]|uniref:helix-turn-helix domain-containing protein n=1 Tax=Massilia sp. MB5 TaxID=2919578 RepID=UPI001F0D8FD6|nr:helix-turn-helix domain-containing protein [Massilia sp. MB5]UMR30847.1 helix-turn-helix domain-containing protein [Massilia sp. MB5]